MNIEKFRQILEKYDTIILHRHLRPDMDAIGSQMGLKYTLEHNFANKKIYVVGDQNKFDYENQMQKIDDSVYNGALVIITDVAVSHMVSDERYKLADKVVVIDHHENACDIENAEVFVDPKIEAAAALTFEILRDLKYEIPQKAAQYFMQGIITDSGRFQYLQTYDRLFLIASQLCKLGADPVKFYNWLYVETLDERKLKNSFSQRMQISKKVAYMINDKEFLQTLGNYDFFQISRGMVNLLAGIDSLPIWVNFTEDVNTNKFVVEARSRNIVIVDVCKKYGGGGHNFACGATIEKKDINNFIQDLNKLI